MTFSGVFGIFNRITISPKRTRRKAGLSKMGTIIGEGITFDDVLLVPSYSEVTPNMIELGTHLTKKLNLMFQL